MGMLGGSVLAMGTGFGAMRSSSLYHLPLCLIMIADDLPMHTIPLRQREEASDVAPPWTFHCGGLSIPWPSDIHLVEGRSHRRHPVCRWFSPPCIRLGDFLSWFSCTPRSLLQGRSDPCHHHNLLVDCSFFCPLKSAGQPPETKTDLLAEEGTTFFLALALSAKNLTLAISFPPSGECSVTGRSN